MLVDRGLLLFEENALEALSNHAYDPTLEIAYRFRLTGERRLKLTLCPPGYHDVGSLTFAKIYI